PLVVVERVDIGVTGVLELLGVAVPGSGPARHLLQEREQGAQQGRADQDAGAPSEQGYRPARPFRRTRGSIRHAQRRFRLRRRDLTKLSDPAGPSRSAPLSALPVWLPGPPLFTPPPPPPFPLPVPVPTG